MSFRRFLLVTALSLPFAVAVAAPAGRVQFVAGDVVVEAVGKSPRTLVKGDTIDEGDTIVAGQTGQAQFVMSDEAIIAVRPGARLRIHTYRYSGKADGNERGILELLRGGFRTITGIIGRADRDAYRVRTPTATVGIRGTDHEPLYIPQPEPGETPIGPPGTYNKVNAGETFIENGSGRLVVGVNQVGFAPPTAGVAPVRLPQIPGFMRGTAPMQGQGGDKRGGAEGQQRRDAQQQRQQGEEDGGRQGQRQGQRQGPRQGPAGGQQAPLLAGQMPPPGAPMPGMQPPPGAPMPGMLPPPGSLPPPGGLLPPLLPPIPGSFDPKSPPPGFVPAPNGFAATGGDLSGSGVGSGAGVVGLDFGLVLDAEGNVNSVGSSGFAYARAGAPLIQQGNTSVGGIPVRWGIYAGGQISDGMGVRNPSFFHFMGAPNATSPAVLSSVLSSPMTFTATAANNEYTKPIAENGVVGGKVALSITLKNVSSTPSVTAYNLGVQDGNSRNWAATLASPVGLGVFLKGSGAQLNVACPACPQTVGSGSAHGVAIGTTTVQGVVTSYDLKAGSAGVTGSVLAR